MLMFRFDRRIISRFESSIKKSAMDGFILKMLKSSVFKMTSFALLIGSVIALVLLFDSRLKPALIQQFSMTVESNYVIAIATLSDWLKRLAPVFSTNETQNQNQSHRVRVIFPAL